MISLNPTSTPVATQNFQAKNVLGDIFIFYYASKHTTYSLESESPAANSPQTLLYYPARMFFTVCKRPRSIKQVLGVASSIDC
jgi:hypothetical protein